MPLYQFFCYKCYKPHEIEMTLSDLEKYDTSKKARNSIKCPTVKADGKVCGNVLEKLICPPKTIRIN